MRPTLAILIALGTILMPTAVLAGAEEVSPTLRWKAETVCREDAFRLCADSVSDEAAVVACMRPKRALLTASCRSVFDEVVRTINH